MSDSGEETERLLLASEEDLKSDILIKGRRHSGRSGSGGIPRACPPQAIVAYHRAFRRTEHVNETGPRLVPLPWD